MSEPLRLDPHGRDASDWERRALRLDPGARQLLPLVGEDLDEIGPYDWACQACGYVYRRLSADGLVPNPGQAKALCDGCLAAAKVGHHGPQ